MLVGRTREREALDDVLARLAAGTAAWWSPSRASPGSASRACLPSWPSGRRRTAWCSAPRRRSSRTICRTRSGPRRSTRTCASSMSAACTRLGIEDPAALAPILPALGGPDGGADRHRLHRALRDLLERLAAPRPFVLWLDDLHWADPGSARRAGRARAPAGRRRAVLLAVAAREGQLPAAGRRPRSPRRPAQDRVTRLVARPARARPRRRTWSAATWPRSTPRAAATRSTSSSSRVPAGTSDRSRPQSDVPAGTCGAVEAAVPEAVALALAAELAGPAAADAARARGGLRRGRPVRPGASGRGGRAAGGGGAGGARRPARPHARAPGERRPAVRVPAPGRAPCRLPGRRRAAGGSAAHTRAAAALERRGAGIVARAHHVEHAADLGDAAAADVLLEAARELQGPAPASAARFHAAALRTRTGRRRPPTPARRDPDRACGGAERGGSTRTPLARRCSTRSPRRATRRSGRR